MLLGAVWSQTPILGSGWVPVRPKKQEDSEKWGKAVCVWLNSTPGMLAQLFCSNFKKLVYPNMSIEGQRKIPIPDLTPAQTDHLAAIFNKNAQTAKKGSDSPTRLSAKN